MKLKVNPIAVWAAGLEDRAGGVAEKLAPLTAAGANFEFLLARRLPENPGQGVVFLTPLKGATQLRAARTQGFLRTEALHSIRVEGPNRPGLAAQIARALATAGVNLRGCSAIALGTKFVAYLALDDVEDVARARRVLRALT